MRNLRIRREEIRIVENKVNPFDRLKIQLNLSYIYIYRESINL